MRTHELLLFTVTLCHEPKEVEKEDEFRFQSIRGQALGKNYLRIHLGLEYSFANPVLIELDSIKSTCANGDVGHVVTLSEPFFNVPSPWIY